MSGPQVSVLALALPPCNVRCSIEGHGWIPTQRRKGVLSRVAVLLPL